MKQLPIMKAIMISYVSLKRLQFHLLTLKYLKLKVQNVCTADIVHGYGPYIIDQMYAHRDVDILIFK